MNKYLLDSFALLEFLENSKGAKFISDLFKDSLNDKAEIFISDLTLSFIESIIIKNYSDNKLEIFKSTVEKLPLNVLDYQRECFTKAFIYNTEYNIKLETAYAIALAEINSYTLLSSNKQLKKLTNKFKIKIF